MKNKKAVIGSFLALIIAAVVSVLMLVNKPQDERFRLEESDYGNGSLIEITAEEYAEKLNNQEEFIVIARNLTCPAEAPLTTVTERLINEEDIKVYSLMADEFKKSTLTDEVKYLPSAAILRDGEVVDFLKADSDEDLQYYKSPENLKKWLEKYVEL